MRRKRKKARLRPKPVLVIGLMAALSTGVWYSPITAVRKVRIEGAIAQDQDRLEEIAKSIQGIPCMQVDPQRIESHVMALPEVASASLSRNPFGSALLRVSYRTPVARLQGSADMLLSDDGVLYQTLQTPPELPIFQLGAGGPPTLVGLAGSWQPGKVANLAIRARTLAPGSVIRIQVERGGVVWLNLDAGRVALGSFDEMDKKLQVLKERMSLYPRELAENEYLNLTEPDRPTLSPRRPS